jgi:hypothetical protein
MPSDYYALVLYRGGIPVHQDAGPLLAVLDFDPAWAQATKAQLNRHRAGELRRQGVDQRWWGEYEMRAYPIDRNGEPQRDVKYRWAWDETDERDGR